MKETIKISALKKHKDNPRLIKDAEYKKLKQSLESFPEMLDVRSIVVNQDNIVIGGNQRLSALKDLGVTEIAVDKVDWDEDKQRRFMIADNQAAGQWDLDLLVSNFEVDELESYGLDTSFLFQLDEEAEEGGFNQPGHTINLKYKEAEVDQAKAIFARLTPEKVLLILANSQDNWHRIIRKEVEW